MNNQIREIIREKEGDPDQCLTELLEDDDRSREELIEDLQHSAGAKIRQEVSSLYTTLEIVNKNYQMLKKGSGYHQDKTSELWMTGNRDRLETFQREYLRLLHNYSASVYSLERQTYTILDRYEDEKPGLKEQYFQEIRDRGLDTEVDLVKQLRHYTQKRELPPLASSMHGKKTEEGTFETEYKLILEKEEMMDWDEWNSDVRERLEAMDERIDITNLASEFQEKLNGFYDWFNMFVLRMFYNEVKQHMVAIHRLEKESGSTDH